MIKNKTTLYLMISMFFLQLSFPCFAMFEGNEDEDIKTVSTVQQRMTGMETDQEKINGLTLTWSRPALLINLKESVDSLTSYFSSSAKAVIQGAYEVVKFTTYNPKLALVVGVAYVLPVAVEACDCICMICTIGNFGNTHCAPGSLGQANGLIDCGNACIMSGGRISSCR